MENADYNKLRDDDSFDPDSYEWILCRSDDGVTLYATEELSEAEAGAYMRRARQYFKPNMSLYAVIDGDYVDLHYAFEAPSFDRIRRITGYLVGTLDRFNDAKRAEESQRVKHGLR